MQYEPIKRIFGRWVDHRPWLRVLFYRGLGIIFLREWHVKKAINGLLTSDQPVALLDAGCGFGQYSYFMANRNQSASIYSVDINPDHVRSFGHFCSQQGLKIKTEQKDLVEWVPDEIYDGIVCVDVMEHIENDRQVFAHFFKGLKPGGWLLISTPSDQGGSDHHHDHDDEDHAHGFIDEHARDGYGVDDIKEKLQSNGFDVDTIRYTYGWPGKVAWKMAVKYPMLLLNASKLLLLILPFYYLVFILPVMFLHMLDVNGSWKTGTGLLVIATKPHK